MLQETDTNNRKSGDQFRSGGKGARQTPSDTEGKEEERKTAIFVGDDSLLKADLESWAKSRVSHQQQTRGAPPLKRGKKVKLRTPISHGNPSQLAGTR